MGHVYQLGEQLHVIISDVRLLGIGSSGLYVELPGVDEAIEVRLIDDDGQPLKNVKIKRSLPADGIPAQGEVWIDRLGSIYLAVRSSSHVRLVDVTGHFFDWSSVHTDVGLGPISRLSAAPTDDSPTTAGSELLAWNPPVPAGGEDQ